MESFMFLGFGAYAWITIITVFACSAVLGVAIQKTGIAERMATGILDICGTNPIVVMTAASTLLERSQAINMTKNLKNISKRIKGQIFAINYCSYLTGL